MKIREIIGNWFSRENELLEMANIHPAQSGLNQVIFIGKVGGRHSARVKVSNVPGTFDANDNFSIALSQKEGKTKIYGTVKIKPKDLEKIEKWIDINREDLIAMVNQMESDRFSGRFVSIDDTPSGEVHTIKTMAQMIAGLKKV